VKFSRKKKTETCYQIAWIVSIDTHNSQNLSQKNCGIYLIQQMVKLKKGTLLKRFIMGTT
jgi:hypothetical protein